LWEQIKVLELQLSGNGCILKQHIMSTDQKKLSIAFMDSIPVDVWRWGEKWMVSAAAGLAGRCPPDSAYFL
jgi:hypothetical protein